MIHAQARDRRPSARRSPAAHLQGTAVAVSEAEMIPIVPRPVQCEDPWSRRMAVSPERTGSV
jgi:hypothetical protein